MRLLRVFGRVVGIFSRKGCNQLRNFWEYRRRRIVLKSAPIVYVIGINNICSLSCPLCVTGQRRHAKKPTQMNFELFRRIIDKIGPYAVYVQLYNWGEPLLHKDIVAMVEYCGRYDLNTEISSSLSLRNIDDKLEAFVAHRLKHLVVSFDGVDQEDYSRYRVGGNFDLVLKNLAALRRFKQEQRSQYPRVTLQYLRTKFTKDQPEIIRKNLGQFGADYFSVEELCMPFRNYDDQLARQWLTEEEISARRYLDVGASMHTQVCSFLYTTMVIEQDGSIPPCCYSTSPADDFGAWDDQKTIQEMYNTDKFQEGRKLFRTGSSKNFVCKGCSAFRTYQRAKSRKQRTVP